MRIPNRVHFVYGLREQTEPFHLVHYLALESCRQILAPEAIYLHYKHLPYGVYWDLIRPYLTLVEVDLVPEVLAAPADERLVPGHYRYAHHADFIRLDALIDDGGVYADIDTLFVRPFPPELFEHPFVIGQEYPMRYERTGALRPSLCNALLMAEPGAEFAVAWRREMAAALDGTWSNHSCFLPYQLSRRMPHAVHVEPTRSFYRYGPFRDDLALLLEELDRDTDGLLSIHLYAHLWWEPWRRDFSDVHGGALTEDHLRVADTTYGALAARFVPELDLW